MTKKMAAIVAPIAMFGAILLGSAAEASATPNTIGPIWPNDCIRGGGTPDFNAPQSPPGQAWYGVCIGGQYNDKLLRRA